MVSYEEALKIARGVKPNIDRCAEYEAGYLFISSKDELSIGGDGPIAVVKESGRVIGQTEFYDSECGEELRDFSVEE